MEGIKQGSKREELQRHGYLGDDADGSHTIGVDLTCNLKSVAVGQVRVRSGDGKDDCIAGLHKAQDHGPNQLFDVLGLKS